MRGIRFWAPNALLAHHMEPLRRRLRHLEVEADPAIVVHAHSPGITGARHVQVFHGLGDKGYTLNPWFLQRRRGLALRHAANGAMSRLGIPLNALRPPRRIRRRAGRYDVVNAYGPRFAQALEGMLEGTEVTRFGHIALNERADLRPRKDGHILWVPTWDSRGKMGGRLQSGVPDFADVVARLAADHDVRVKLHPKSAELGQFGSQLKRLRAAGVRVEDPDADVYAMLAGARAVLTDTSSLGFEAYCMGFPVAVARPRGTRPTGLHAELEQRVDVLEPEVHDMARWAQRPPAPGDRAWREDLLYSPATHRNDAFAAWLEARHDVWAAPAGWRGRPR